MRRLPGVRNPAALLLRSKPHSCALTSRLLPSGAGSGSAALLEAEGLQSHCSGRAMPEMPPQLLCRLAPPSANAAAAAVLAGARGSSK